MKFAEGTTVPVAKTRGEIEAMVERYGASEFASGWTAGQASIQFAAKGRRVRFTVHMPDEKWARDAIMKRARPRYWHRDHIPVGQAQAFADAEGRRLWRCLLLAIKSKLENVESGIATFDEEFLAHVVLDDGMTVYERIQQAGGGGKPLLPPVQP